MTQTIKLSWIELTSQDTGILQRMPTHFTLPEGSTVGHALDALNFGQVKEQLLKSRSVAVFGQYALAETLLHEGDRIEILDALRFDPKESRRRRAAHKEQDTNTGKAAPRRSKKRNSMG